MKNWMLNSLKISLVFIGLVILAISIFWLPNTANTLAKANPEYAYLKYPLLLGIYLTCIPFYIGVFNGYIILKLIEKDKAFTEYTNRSLTYIFYSSIGIILMYILGIVYLIFNGAGQPGIVFIGVGIILMSFIIASAAGVLKALLVKVIEIKNEYDLTI
ncbi:MAG: hypothetical protein BSOLF_0572 [Candidatus Carbobacillus altaicus]|uniref:DUF2975 domain-containing protein n=1 Tax=Candidatus Carbonibacillus altaicus TaxID=2163959 RepID=A0A2R6Y0S3_9BACL|nr:MAG: hypothetical protein BSOLF_0572 [Candidatus Carbobacillus altaicus]